MITQANPRADRLLQCGPNRRDERVDSGLSALDNVRSVTLVGGLVCMIAPPRIVRRLDGMSERSSRRSLSWVRYLLDVPVATGKALKSARSIASAIARYPASFGCR